MRTAAALLTAMCLITAGPAMAETLKITNKASGIACYDTMDLITAHGALGYYKLETVERLVVQDRCFIIPKHWRATLLERQRIQGVDVDMVNVRLYSSSESRFAWSLKANFETAFGDQ